ncbi:D-alanyl-D-alanine carboxypeptidase DacC [Actinoplanes italicus]|uniref:D-alanyl-D-alanine carboxypeptidase/D-alanyl-D-alanine-endopeptidase (Penicillin-binding protein 4) n=1 Tax=Actinoplanes italicus TaxID=113567 RepID=A0A2T0JWN5_9ACTN|nr:D-alanyl-D-alanine carboxypeptidase/D-alanyl-D-alanine-endopeptidase [Actinoplanes italicus]PRX12150.1 D-alanyl-D-alanine carboxypeptidase/D-alanyl-D-alanine-endopeptidase (penicillin-binding protein 4) [Actinoplanes italicus]GIE35787.1 D-alanyl-D-alanine carboxypeptidase DacC [Actinoplanes italicus]
MRCLPALAALVAGTLLALPDPAVATPARTATAAIARTAQVQAVQAELDRILDDPRLAGATVAADVRDAATGAVVYQRNPLLRVLPASNQKLLTAAAALEVLGPGHRFRTTAATAGRSLHLHGQGDPTLTYDRIDRLAEAVARTGGTRYDRLIADASWFDRVPLGLDWSWQDESSTAPVSALTFAANARFDNAAVEIRYAGVGGRRPVVRVWPPDTGVRVVNRAVTGGSGDTVSAVREHGTATVTLRGSVAAGRSGTALATVPDPAAVTTRLFRAALLRHGVTVGGRTAEGAAPAEARELAAQVSPPLAEILRPLLKLSNNGIAEILVKAMSRAAEPGRPGSWPTGLPSATAALGRLGVDTRLLTMGDGSGLSRRNWVTVSQIATLLQKAQRCTWFPAFRAALPIAGDPDPMVGGTLRERMRGTPAAGNVRAKTGTLTGVNTLSGYVTAADGRRLVFALIVNGSLTSAAPVLDEVVVTLAAARGLEYVPAIR